MRLLTIIPKALIIFVVMFSFSALTLNVEAQTSANAPGPSISGDDLCGKWDPVAQKVTKPCDINMAANAVKGMLKLVIILGTPLLFIFVAYRFLMAYFLAQQGNANAYKDALKKAVSAIFGFVLIVALFGGLLAVVLQFLGVKDAPLSIIKLFSEAIATHAYAAETAASAPTTEYLPSFLQSNNIYDFIMMVFRTFMRFFVYPVLIIIWVWTGFSFVAAQGNPDALNKAKKWLVGALISTLVIFMLQAFLIALKGTVQEILPGNNVTTPSTGTVDGRGAPAPGTAGEACSENGIVGGIRGVDLKCYPGRGSPGVTGSPTPSQCTGKTPGTLCSVVTSSGTKTGTCSNNTENTFGCYIATQNDPCINTAGVYGYISASGGCEPGGRPLTGKGGSCINSSSCASPLICDSAKTCQNP